MSKAAFHCSLRRGLLDGFALLDSPLNQYFGEITMCTGPSMLPTFNIGGDIVLVEYVSWKWFRKLERGEVVVAISPLTPTRAVCKRVLGLPGDKVLVDPTKSVTDFVTVSIKLLYDDNGGEGDSSQRHVWLQGDNLNNSTDSRKYGPVPMGYFEASIK
ncbi:peptidase S24/S26A/S26B/S26C [Chytridium lagenaria]|nr:peptidase S24/S26A/S26B/S26C [Chytridium lagenaria]